MTRLIRNLAPLCIPALWLASGVLLQAQARLGSLAGTVTDETGALVDGARVIVENPATGAMRSALTEQGRYRIAGLDLGIYTIQVESSSFAPDVRTGVALNINRETELQHVLRVAGERQSATVTAEVRVVDASLSGVSNLITGDTIREQPLNGRDFLQLALLQPGVTVSRTKNSNNNTGYGIQLSIGGSRPVQNNFRMDGVSLTDYTGSSTGSVNGVNLGVDTLQEFSVLTDGFSAEYGRAAGGVVNAATRSGSNELHGTLSYFHRNDNLDARNFFDLADQPEFRRHQFGATVGGPIRRDRTFFFAGYESLREVRGNTTTSTTLSDAARNGIVGGQPIDIDPEIAKVLPFFPSPNGPVSGDTGLFIFTNDTAAVEHFLTSRLDHRFSDNHSMFARYSFDDAKRQSLSAFAVNRSRTSTRPQSFAIEDSRILSASLLNSLRFGVTRGYSLNNLTSALNPGLDDPEFAFLPGARSLGRMDITGLTLFPGGSGADDSDRQAFTSFQVYDDLSYTRGDHYLKAGFALERTHLNADSQSLNSGEFRFPTVLDFLQNRSNRFRSILPGTDTIRGIRQWIGAWYIQDRWQMHRSLSLELGVRHEWITVPTEVNGKLANLDSLLNPTMRVGDPLFNNPSLKNFAPRIGLAWNVPGTRGTVVRAGYGIYYDQILSPYLLISGFRNPPAYLSGSIQGLKAGRFPAGGFIEMVTNPSIDARAERLPRDPGQPYVQQWNLNLQQSLGIAGSLRLVYAGSRGVRLSEIVEDANLAPSVTLPDGRIFFPAGGAKANPNFGIIRDRLFEGSSFYHSLQAGWDLRLRRGFQAQVSYVLSKNIDDDSTTFAQTESENTIGIPVTGNSKFNRGLSNYDQRHNLVANFTAELPSPHPGFTRKLFGGWRASSIIALSSGAPFSITLAYDAARTLTQRADRRGGQRPDWNPNFTGDVITGDPNQWFNPGAFLRPEAGFLGTLGRNTLTGPGRATVDFVLAKRVLISDGRVAIDLRLEAFNALNRANFNLPAAERLQLFNRTGVREDAGRITSASPGRELQAGVKVQF